MVYQLEMSHLSRDWLPWEIEPTMGAATVTIGSAEIAVTADDNGVVPDAAGTTGWNAATVTDNGTALVTASLMVGPGGTVDPGPGRWRTWLRYVDGTRRPVATGLLLLT